MQKINILGETYTVNIVEERNEFMEKEGLDGYCDVVSKEIFVIANDMKKISLRHELVHAYLFECGLEPGYSFHNEDVVNWIACALPKLNRVMSEAGAFNE